MKKSIGRMFGSREARRTAKTLVRHLPDFLKLLYGLVRDGRVSGADKAILGATIAYVLTPVDLIPDVLVGIGLVDDLFLVGLALDRLLRRTDAEVLFNHWEGDPETLYLLMDELDRLGSLLPDGVREALRGKVEDGSDASAGRPVDAEARPGGTRAGARR